jgi:hypothetical protein
MAAARIFPNEYKWSYYVRSGRVITNARQTTGTVAYDHSGGSSERLLTITGSTFPDWARFGRVRIDDHIHQVAEWIDSTNLQLSVDMNPGADIASGATYSLFRDSYPLPADLVSIDQLYVPDGTSIARFVHAREWHLLHRYTEQTSSTWLFYTIMGSRDYQNTLELALWPEPDSVFPVDFMYRRRMEPMRNEEVSAGRVTTAVGDKTVTGDSTAFSDVHVGAIMRFSENNDAEIPTGRTGANPYFAERTVMSVASATELEVDQEFNDVLTNVKYTISDPLDVEPGTMATAFLRCLEWQLSIVRRMFGERGEMKIVRDMYQEALRQAKESDSRVDHPRSVGSSMGFGRWPRPLVYLPSGADVE